MGLKFLKENWDNLAVFKNTDFTDIRNYYWKIIKSKYTENHRKYHNFQHIEECILHLNKISSQPGIEFNLDLLHIAIWFHDIIYYPRSKTNEKDSFDLCKQFCKKIELEKKEISEIESLIIATIAHQSNNHGLQSLNYMIDIDLAILGQNKKRF